MGLYLLPLKTSLDLLGIYYAKKEEYQPNFLRRLFGIFTLLREPKRNSLYNIDRN